MKFFIKNKNIFISHIVQILTYISFFHPKISKNPNKQIYLIIVISCTFVTVTKISCWYSFNCYVKYFRYYLGLAQLASTNSCDAIPTRLQWLFSPYGYKFFISHKFTKAVKSKSLPFTSSGNILDPLAIQMKVSEFQENWD